MRRKFKLKVCYTFHGAFTLRAATRKAAPTIFYQQRRTGKNQNPKTLPPKKPNLVSCYPPGGASPVGAPPPPPPPRLVSEQCGTVLNTIRTTLSEESEVDWHFDKHPRLAIREVIALPETLDGEKLPRVGVFHPGQRVFWRDPADETSGYYTVCSGNDDVEEPSEDDIILICSSDSEAEVFPCELRPVSDNH